MRKSIAMLFLAAVFLGIVIAVRAIPEGAQLTLGAAQTRTAPSASSAVADGGNVTELNISASSQTQVWQGFWGEVNGSIVLEDTSGDVFYSWNITNVSGEVYASRSNSVNFANIFPINNCTMDENLTGTGSDRVNQTFFRSTNAAANVGLVLINASTACGARTYISSAPNSLYFQEMILSPDPNNRSNTNVTGNTSVFATILEQDRTGFDGATHDFQILLPVNVTTGLTTYYFYAELS